MMPYGEEQRAGVGGADGAAGGAAAEGTAETAEGAAGGRAEAGGTAPGQGGSAAEPRGAAPDAIGAGAGSASGPAGGAGGEAAADPAAADAPPSAGHRRPVRPGDIASGPFLLSASERRLWKDNVEIVLTPTEWTLVKLLMERDGEGLSRDDILNSVWGRHYVGDLKIVDVNIRRIRQKIEVRPSDPKHIETLWGYGYRWNRGDGQ
ncbi:winged helix-turn-helix domain-containing protein [Paenibacillus sp. UNC496MF]|uniref:winged helix-turn-helix domain-containing protein n=1 Tax=Paenibacillus sp. UNC496MF TaxID=1502753 RepID=UPI0015A53832